MKEKLATVRGMRDFLPEDLRRRRRVEQAVRELFRSYNYEEIETPVVEYYDLFAAKSGEEITQRMYIFSDLSGRKLALRPEGTAPVARIIATKLRTTPKPIRLGYIWNFFRYDEPQKGRYRQFYQAGFELFGSARPEADAEILTISNELMEKLGFRETTFKINQVGALRGLLKTFGVKEKTQNHVLGLIDKKHYGDALKALASQKAPKECKTSLSKLFELRGEDSKRILSEASEVVRGSAEAVEAYETLGAIIDSVKASNARFLVDCGFARGLEYYTGTIFEVYTPPLDIAVLGGGRYDRLVETFGGEPTPAVGCSPGIDRITLAMDELKLFEEHTADVKVYVVPVGELGVKAAEIASAVRRAGFAVEVEVSGRALKNALSYASAKKFRYAVIVAPQEMSRNAVLLRDMEKQSQEEVSVGDLLSRLNP